MEETFNVIYVKYLDNFSMFLFFYYFYRSIVASTELSDEAVFNRNSSESINARCQPRKPEST